MKGIEEFAANFYTAVNLPDLSASQKDDPVQSIPEYDAPLLTEMGEAQEAPNETPMARQRCSIFPRPRP